MTIRSEYDFSARLYDMYNVSGIRAGKPSFNSGPYTTELEASTAAGVYAYSLLLDDDVQQTLKPLVVLQDQLVTFSHCS